MIAPINTLNAELNPICHLMTLLGAHHILHVSKVRVKFKFASPKGIEDVVNSLKMKDTYGYDGI
jgi:hypothetical protein